MRSRCLILLALLSLVGCAYSDPVGDARRALEAGDRRLAGYMNYGLVVPGTPEGFSYHDHEPGIRRVSNVTDTSSPSETEKVAKYAKRYNRVILADRPETR